MNKLLVLVVLVLLVACSVRETAVTRAPVKETVSSSEPAATPTSPETTPTATPPRGGTTSSEPIGGTTDCAVAGDCITYLDHGMAVEKCAGYDTLGCYRSFACTSSGEAVQKETPAFCGH